MSAQDVHAPTLGASGEPCSACGALLAADQRYCLNCGARRTDARLAFKEILATKGAGVVGVEGTAGDYGVAAPADAPPAGPVATGPRHDGGSRSALAALAGLACLLLALGVGVLIGNSGKDRTAATPAPQVISVGGAAAGTTTGASGTTTPATTTPSSSGSSSKSGGSSSSGSSSSTTGGSKATNKSLQNLNKLSTKAYQKQSTKLPKVVGTGGKAPPKDNKPAAGGGSFQTIG